MMNTVITYTCVLLVYVILANGKDLDSTVCYTTDGWNITQNQQETEYFTYNYDHERKEDSHLNFAKFDINTCLQGCRKMNTIFYSIAQLVSCDSHGCTTRVTCLCGNNIPRVHNEQNRFCPHSCRADEMNKLKLKFGGFSDNDFSTMVCWMSDNEVSRMTIREIPYDDPINNLSDGDVSSTIRPSALMAALNSQVYDPKSTVTTSLPSAGLTVATTPKLLAQTALSTNPLPTTTSSTTPLLTTKPPIAPLIPASTIKLFAKQSTESASNIIRSSSLHPGDKSSTAAAKSATQPGENQSEEADPEDLMTTTTTTDNFSGDYNSGDGSWIYNSADYNADTDDPSGQEPSLINNFPASPTPTPSKIRTKVLADADDKGLNVLAFLLPALVFLVLAGGWWFRSKMTKSGVSKYIKVPTEDLIY